MIGYNRIRMAIGCTACAFVLASCTLGPDYLPPSPAVADAWQAGPEATDVSSVAAESAWWVIFDDPMLTDLIAQSARANPTIEQARANVVRSRALYGVARGDSLPQLGAGGGAARSGESDQTGRAGNAGTTDTLYDSGFDASWEIDLFGGNRREREAAAARIGESVADYHAVMLSTFSEVARQYYTVRGLQKRIAIRKNNIGLLKESFDLIDRRKRAGESSAFDLVRARGEYEASRALLPDLEAELRRATYRLSVLTGRPPEALVDTLLDEKAASGLPGLPGDLVPVGLRSDILTRRPDVRAAERALAASVADIGAARADLFPRFFLTGDATAQARNFGDLFTASALGWGLGALIDWSIFNGGALRAQVDVEKAENRIALAAYEGVVLDALADAESSLITYGRAVETERRLSRAVESRRESASLAHTLFEGGEEDYLAVLDAQRDLIAAEDDLVLAEIRSTLALVALYTALGGGWDAFPE